MNKSIFFGLFLAISPVVAGCGHSGDPAEEHATTVAQVSETASAQAAKRQENLKLARGLLAEVRGEDKNPGWANEVLRGNNTTGKICELFARFSAGKELRDLMREIRATPQIWAEIGIAPGDFANLWRGVAMDAAPATLAMLKNPPPNKFEKCVRDGTIIFLHDELKLVRIILDALRTYAPGPATIGSSEQELRDFLIKGGKRFVEETRPRLKESADAQGGVQSLLEEYALTPDDVGLTPEELTYIYRGQGN